MQRKELSLNNLDGSGIFALMAKALEFGQPQSETVKRPDIRGDDVQARSHVRRRGLLQRIDHWDWTRQQRAVEAYLAKSTDVCDLELRIRALERKVPPPYY